MIRLLISCATAAAALAATGLPASGLADTGAAPRLNRYLLDARIVESSGLETAGNFRRVLYTHNDSGDSARFFAVGATGRTRAVYTLANAEFRDWEDMSAGPGGKLWFADIGDNGRQRTSVSVYRVREPTTLVSDRVPSRRFDFRYADGQSHNAEALLVRPSTGVLYIATKQSTGAALYRAPRHLSPYGYNMLTRVAAAPAIVTGGDFSHDGERLVLRTGQAAHVYRHIGGSARLVDLPIGGESVAFTRHDGALLVGKEGSKSPVWRVPLA